MKSFATAALTVTMSLATLLSFSTAHGSLKITKTYDFPIAKYEAVEAAINEAAARADQKSVFAKQLDTGDRSSVRCLENSPQPLPGDRDGRIGFGCLLSFVTDLGNGASLEATQMLALEKTSAEIRKLIADADASKQSRLQLPLMFDGGQGSSYYCDSVAGAWNCKLKFVSSGGY